MKATNTTTGATLTLREINEHKKGDYAVFDRLQKGRHSPKPQAGYSRWAILWCLFSAIVICAAAVSPKAYAFNGSPIFLHLLNVPNPQAIPLNANSVENIFIFNFSNYVEPLTIHAEPSQHFLGRHAKRDSGGKMRAADFSCSYWNEFFTTNIPRFFKFRAIWEGVSEPAVITPSSNNSWGFPVIFKSIDDFRTIFCCPLIGIEISADNVFWKNKWGISVPRAFHQSGSGAPQFFGISRKEGSNNEDADREGGKNRLVVIVKPSPETSKAISESEKNSAAKKGVIFILGTVLVLIMVYLIINTPIKKRDENDADKSKN